MSSSVSILPAALRWCSALAVTFVGLGCNGGGREGSSPSTAGAARERLDVVASSKPKEADRHVENSTGDEPLLGFRPNYVDFDLAFGERATQEVQLFGKLADSEQVTIKETGDELISVAWSRRPAPYGTTLRIECRGDRVGMHAGSIVLSLPKGAGSDSSLSWGCKVKGTLTVDPTTPYFNLKQSGDRATIVTVRSRRSGFKVLSARVTEGPFLAELRPKTSTGDYPIVVRVQNQLIPDEARAATGTLVVESNDKTEPSKSIPLFGMGHVNKAERVELSEPAQP